MPAKRGVLYLKWGNKFDALLNRSMASLRAFHPELAVHVHELPESSNFLDKAAMFDFSPFEETLYLDADTVVLDRLDFAFERAERVGLACAICECPWARRYGGIKGDTIEYNTGVLFFTKKSEPVFRAWNALARTVDSSTRVNHNNQVVVVPVNDQAGFALAIEDTKFVPFVLPCNWNFRPRWQKSFFGPLKIWHDYENVPAPLPAWNAQQCAPGAIIDYAGMG